MLGRRRSAAINNITSWRASGYGKMCAMANRKRKPKRFRAVEAVKAMARERIGTPPAGRVLQDRRTEKTEKHKPTLGKWLRQE
jgi:hypothetical protein